MWSDLSILVVGPVDRDRSDMFCTLNALVGRQAFNRDRWTEKQEACVEVEGGRRLLVTYLPETLFRDMGDVYSEGRTTELDKTVYHCVVIVMEFNESDLNVWYNSVVTETLSQKFGESFLRKHCVVIVGGGDGFDKAQRERRETRTFLEWCRGKGTKKDYKAVFHCVQERWLLFNNNGSQNQLNQRRQHLVFTVDTQILVGSHYTNMKFKEVEINAAQLEKQNLDLKGELEKKTKEILETRASDVQKSEQQFSHLREKVTERLQVLEQMVEKLKQQLEEKIRSVVKKQKSDSCKMMERLQKLTSQIEEIKGELERTRERSLWNRVVSLPQSLPLQTSPRLGLALLVLLVLFSLLIPLLRPEPTNRQREITMLDEGLDLRRYVNSKFEESTKRLREMERRIAGLKIDGQDKTGASNEKESERADKRIQQIEEQFAELKEQVMIDSTVQVEEIQRIVEEK